MLFFNVQGSDIGEKHSLVPVSEILLHSTLIGRTKNKDRYKLHFSVFFPVYCP